MVDVAQTLAAGRYQLGAVIGAGGSGSVRRAHDRLLDRSVAVKLLHHDGGDETDRQRMRAEAQLAGSLVHPGIASIYDYGEEPDPAGGDGLPTPYIVMQHVEGASLWQVLRERRTLPPTEVMRIVMYAADALQAAHEAGIVHRDLKPANLLLTEDGGVVIVDFGIARTRGADPLTRTGAIVGTVDYLSPEQAEGRSATPQSDLYALGMVAYECLTGRKPFRRENDVATALAHLLEDAPELDPEVPPPVRALVGSLMAKDPESRPADAAEVARRAAGLALPTAEVAAPVESTAAAGSAGAAPARRPATAWRRRLLRSRRTYVAAGVLVAAVAGSALVAARPASSRVPDLRGERWATASRTLDGRGLEAHRQVVDDPAAHRGTVLRQDVPPGTTAHEGAVVTLSVASGRTDLDASDVLGESWHRAARDLVALGLVPERRSRAQGSDLGRVVGVHPTGRLRLGATVTLTVAREPDPAATTSSTTAPSRVAQHSTRTHPARKHHHAKHHHAKHHHARHHAKHHPKHHDPQHHPKPRPKHRHGHRPRPH